MSARMECDAPNCSSTRSLTAVFNGGWLTVKPAFKAEKHFHSLLCVAAWALAQQSSRLEAEQKRVAQ